MNSSAASRISSPSSRKAGQESRRRAVEALCNDSRFRGKGSSDAPEDLYDRAVQRLVSDTASRSPAGTHAELSETYESLLSFSAERDPDGRIRVVADRGRRKRAGAFYTPPAMAHAVVEAALGPFSRDGAPPTVLDPTMGAGVFLREAIRIIGREWGITEEVVAETCAFGVDRDPVAVDVAVLGIARETGACENVLRSHLVVGDLLSGMPSPIQAPDAVVGNPPWGADLGAPYPRPIPVRLNPATLDSFKLFLELAARLTTGTLGMIVPRAVLLQTGHQDIRSLLLDRFAPLTAYTLGDRLFRGAAAPACALMFGLRPGPDAVTCVNAGRARPAGTEATSYTVPAASWSPEGFHVTDPALRHLVARLQAAYPSLADLRHRFRVRDTGLNYSRASVARRSLYRAVEPDHPQDFSVYRGRDFARYTPIVPRQWLRHDVWESLEAGERVSFGRATVDLPEKIVLRQTADRIVATLDRTRTVMGRSVIAITAEADDSLLVLLAVLNSRLCTMLYRVLADEEGRTLPQVKVSRLLALPVPIPIDGIMDGSMMWSVLHDLAAEQLAHEGKASQLDTEIDGVVYEAYGLSRGDIRLVEGIEDVSAPGANPAWQNIFQ